MAVSFASMMIFFSTVSYLPIVGYLLYPGVTIPITQAPHTRTPLIEGIETGSILGTTVSGSYQSWSPQFPRAIPKFPNGWLSSCCVMLLQGWPSCPTDRSLTKSQASLKTNIQPSSFLNDWAKLRVGLPSAHSNMDSLQN